MHGSCNDLENEGLETVSMIAAVWFESPVLKHRHYILISFGSSSNHTNGRMYMPTSLLSLISVE